jgi:hypothetical protein
MRDLYKIQGTITVLYTLWCFLTVEELNVSSTVGNTSQNVPAYNIFMNVILICCYRNKYWNNYLPWLLQVWLHCMCSVSCNDKDLCTMIQVGWLCFKIWEGIVLCRVG